MKALSVWPEWAAPIMVGEKCVECRSWSTSYRGPLLICASNKPLGGYVHGHALCVVDLVGVMPFGMEHLGLALLDDVPDNHYAWLLDNVRMVKPFPVKGRQMLFDVPDDSIEVLGPPTRELVESHYMPLVHRGRGVDVDGLWSDIFYELGW